MPDNPIKIMELVNLAEAPNWPIQPVHIAPALWEIITQTAQDVGVTPSAVINVWLAGHVVRIDNDET